MPQGNFTLAYNRGMGKQEAQDWQEGWLLHSQSKRRGYTEPEQETIGRVRGRVLVLLCMVSMAVLLARLVYLQTVTSKSHSLLAETNHIEQVTVEAPRGKILDASGVVLAEGNGKGRQYLLGEDGAHLVGYMAETTGEEVGCHEGYCYSPGSYTGRYGAEAVFEQKLRGKNGNRVVEVDARGREVRELGANAPQAGEDVKLSVDAKLQETMAHAMGDKVGAVVALDLSGHLLGLYSSPSFDPSKVAGYLGDTTKQYFLDRAIAGAYPPGSVFKPVVAYAGLEEGKITSDTKIEDTGEIRIDQYRYGNWYFDQYGRLEGELVVARALGRSNDIFFYKTGELVGVDSIVKWAHKFGLGEKTGIELSPESAGFVPDRLWKERTTGERWFLGNTYHLAIGQGDLLTTPLQIARMTGAIVSGRLCPVTVLWGETTECKDLDLASADIETVKEGMRQACATGGTAYPFFDFAPPVLCKTGTAEHAGQKTADDKPHAWITVVYPAESPKIVLTVLLESAGEGSAEAGPVAREILENWSHL